MKCALIVNMLNHALTNVLPYSLRKHADEKYNQRLAVQTVRVLAARDRDVCRGFFATLAVAGSVKAPFLDVTTRG